MHRKIVDWRGTSRVVVRAWPKRARATVGDELMRVQLGADPRHGAALADIGRGVREIRVSSDGGAYRVVYVATLGQEVYVLHAFQKKAKHGIATPRQEKDLARQRYKELCAELSARVPAPRREQ